MKLVKPATPTDDARHKIERETYQNHCRDIASIIAAGGKKPQDGIDLYLVSVNADTEP
jgi:hypothetical protein